MMIDYFIDAWNSASEYLTDNTIEVLIVAVAFGCSKSRMLPGFLVAYILIMTITFGENQKYLNRLAELGPYWVTYNKQVALIFLFEGLVMLALAGMALLNVSKLSAITTAVISSQSMLSIVMAVYFYAYAVDVSPYIPSLMEIHYFSQTGFVILYCVIAWMCVLFSRKANERKRK